MRVTFFSNFLNHHQLPFCQAMMSLVGAENFMFVATEAIPQERLDMGYTDMDQTYPAVLRAYDGDEYVAKAIALALKNDVIITGSAPEMYTKMRIKEGKLTFRYSERLFKKDYRSLLSPRAWFYAYQNHLKHRNAPLYMLCASAFTAADYAKYGAYKGKTYKWGYFPEVKQQDMDALFARKCAKNRPSILWVGRLIGWKHPDASIRLAERLKKEGYAFDLKIIGNGELSKSLKRMIDKKGLQDCVQMLGAMSPQEVRSHMEEADIFLFTSDFNEGWGAVLNESMNSGCAVVASHAIGSVPFLIEDRKNGMIYQNGNQKSLYACVKQLLDNPQYREEMGVKAYHTLADTWNAEVAAKRLLQLVEHLKSGKSGSPFNEGPCSVAPIMKNEWYSSYD